MMNTNITTSMLLNVDHLNIKFSSFDKINKKDISKIYIVESKDATGIHYEIASTEHPVWTSVKHFFISLFTLFKYKYESGQNAINKINNNPNLLKALNKKMTKTALPVLNETPKENQNFISATLKEDISKELIKVLFGAVGAMAARQFICTTSITDAFTWQNFLFGVVVINGGTLMGNALFGTRGAQIGGLLGQSMVIGTENVFANTIGYMAGSNIGEIVIGLLPGQAFRT